MLEATHLTLQTCPWCSFLLCILWVRGDGCCIPEHFTGSSFQQPDPAPPLTPSLTRRRQGRDARQKPGLAFPCLYS